MCASQQVSDAGSCQRRFILEQASPEAVLEFIRGSTVQFYRIASRAGLNHEAEVTAFWRKKVAAFAEPLWFVRDTLTNEIVLLHIASEAERQATSYEAAASGLGLDITNPPGRRSYWHRTALSISLERIAKAS